MADTSSSAAPPSMNQAAIAPTVTSPPVPSSLADPGVIELLAQLDRELVGIAPVKARIRDIAALLLVDRLRQARGLSSGAPSLHMCFTGNPGTGKTTVALRMAGILHRLGYVRKGQLVAVTRDDLVGQYIGHTAPKTREVLKRAMGGVLFIDEAYYLYRPENERDYGQEAIEILLQAMENQRNDLVVILAGYPDRMARFFESNPGMSSRVAHHLAFPDYAVDELQQIADLMLRDMQYRFDDSARAVFPEYLKRRMAQPHFANARSVRNALDRARLRHASRLMAAGGEVDDIALTELSGADLLASSLFAGAGLMTGPMPADDRVDDGPNDQTEASANNRTNTRTNTRTNNVADVQPDPRTLRVPIPGDLQHA